MARATPRRAGALLSMSQYEGEQWTTKQWFVNK